MTCPPRHELAALSDENALPPERYVEIIRHAGECADCQEILQELSDTGASLDVLLERRRRRPPAPAPASVPPSTPTPAQPFGRWGGVLLVAAAGAFGLAVAFGVKARQQAAALRATTAAAAEAEHAARRVGAEAKLAAAQITLTRGLSALDDGDPAGADDVAKAAAEAKAVAEATDQGDDVKAAAAALAARAEGNRAGWTFPRGPAHPGYRPRLAVFTPNEQRLLTVADDPRVVVWDAASGKALAACVPAGDAGGRFEALAVSPDGGYVAAGGSDGRVWMWNLPAGGEAQPISRPVDVGNGRPVWVVGFNLPRLVTEVPRLWAVGPDGALRDWLPVVTPGDRPTGRPPTGLDREAGPGPRVGPVYGRRSVIAAGADPSGRFAFTADADGTFRYWDVATRTPLGPPATTPGPAPR
ncbi:MAG TPA: hypothetical protein VH092_06580 [Urbifossiella sp.]|jgi:hypothetical protein|nr:hypothetical protein [Urbifossiella sp.]